MSRSRSKKTDLHGADAEVLQILALQSGDPHRIRRVLGSGEAISPSLVPHVIPLLGFDGAALDAMRALRTAAARRPGMLIDALLDVERPPVVRRRLARVLSVCQTRDVVDALLQACDDEHISLRAQCARTLFLLRRRQPDLQVDAAGVLVLVQKEIDGGAQDIGLIFTLLALTFPAAPIRVAYRSLRGRNAHARGFAMEYLNGVLPAEMLDKLAPVLDRMRRSR